MANQGRGKAYESSTEPATPPADNHRDPEGPSVKADSTCASSAYQVGRAPGLPGEGRSTMFRTTRWVQDPQTARGSPCSVDRPDPERLTPDQICQEQQVRYVLECLQLRKTAEQQFASDEDVQAIQATLRIQEEQYERLSKQMLTLDEMMQKADHDEWFVVRYMYALENGIIDAPGHVKKFYLVLYLDAVQEAQRREARGERLYPSEEYLLYGPSCFSAPALAVDPINNGAVAGPVRSSAPDGPLSIAGTPSNETTNSQRSGCVNGQSSMNRVAKTHAKSIRKRVLRSFGASNSNNAINEPRLLFLSNKGQHAPDRRQLELSDCHDWPSSFEYAKTPNVNWSRFRVVGEALDRIHNIVLASSHRPELFHMLDYYDAHYKARMIECEA